MQFHTFHGIDQADKATGLGVVIDVFRAFSTACYIFNNRAVKIIPVSSVEEARALKAQHPNYLLMGEDHGLIPEGFDYGNSPSQFYNKDFSGKTVVLTTTRGTKGIVNAKHLDDLITGSFVNAGAVIDYITLQQPKVVSFICTNKPMHHSDDEDAECAQYIQDMLEGKKPDYAEIVARIRTGGNADHFFDPKNISHPQEDYDYCVNLNALDFVIRREVDADGSIYLKRI